MKDVRRFLRRANFFEQAAPDVATALAHHGYIQIDPLNVCGRMHDLILRNRVAGYREGDLMRHLHGEEGAPHTVVKRTAFEHHLPGKNILVAFPQDAWPFLLGEMEARARRTGAWSGKLTPREKAFVPQLLAELKARGPLSSEDLHDGRSSYHGWGASTLAKSTLRNYFSTGGCSLPRESRSGVITRCRKACCPPPCWRKNIPMRRNSRAGWCSHDCVSTAWSLLKKPS